jgi:hypothetical protein
MCVCVCVCVWFRFVRKYSNNMYTFARTLLWQDTRNHESEGVRPSSQEPKGLIIIMGEIPYTKIRFQVFFSCTHTHTHTHTHKHNIYKHIHRVGIKNGKKVCVLYVYRYTITHPTWPDVRQLYTWFCAPRYSAGVLLTSALLKLSAYARTYRKFPEKTSRPERICVCAVKKKSNRKRPNRVTIVKILCSSTCAVFDKDNKRK